MADIPFLVPSVNFFLKPDLFGDVDRLLCSFTGNLVMDVDVPGEGTHLFTSLVEPDVTFCLEIIVQIALPSCHRSSV